MVAHFFYVFLNSLCARAVLGSGVIVKGLAPTHALDFRSFADCYSRCCGSCSFESMLDFGWTLAAFANGSDLRVFCVYVSRYCK